VTAPNRFVPAADPRPRPGPGLWFVFQGRSLLVDAAYGVRHANWAQALGLAPVRVLYLGTLDGSDCFAAELAADAEPPPGGVFVPLRQLYGRLDDTIQAVAARAVQMLEWDRGHRFCGACGEPTELHPSHPARLCPSCGATYYPRLAPAMIVAVERGEEILLARSPHFPPGIFSVLAGFVEPGESAEDAVHREVFEESAIRVRDVRYFGSQSWPFPHSLMLGFQAEYAEGDVVPQESEIEAAGFFHVDALPPLFPGNVSISQWLIRDFCRRHGRGL
jgi:NAD+ diphosphatase